MGLSLLGGQLILQLPDAGLGLRQRGRGTCCGAAARVTDRAHIRVLVMASSTAPDSRNSTPYRVVSRSRTVRRGRTSLMRLPGLPTHAARSVSRLAVPYRPGLSMPGRA